MRLQDTITRENLKYLMRLFYERAIVDPVIGHYFIHELGEDMNHEEWHEHIELLADFWQAVLLEEGPYWGNPSGTHFGIANLTRESFMQWIALFSLTVNEVYVPELASRFKQEGVYFSERFMQDLNI